MCNSLSSHANIWRQKQPTFSLVILAHLAASCTDIFFFLLFSSEYFCFTHFFFISSLLSFLPFSLITFTTKTSDTWKLFMMKITEPIRVQQERVQIGTGIIINPLSNVSIRLAWSGKQHTAMCCLLLQGLDWPLPLPGTILTPEIEN